LSSEALSGTSGVAAMDELCQSDARGAGLTGTFAALVATTSTAAVARFDLMGPRWVRPDGTPIVETAQGLRELNFTSAVDQYANGGRIAAWLDDVVMVGSSLPDRPGTAASTCNDWTAIGAGTGWKTAMNAGPSPVTVDCYTGARLLCLER
jgi:hypothetical protein